MNDFPTPIPSLRLISEQILRPNWHHVKDVGDCPYEVIANLLKLSTAAQLATIEGSTPHLTKSTDHIWKDLCVKDFVEVRKLVEDSKIEVSQSIDGSWKAKYFEEEEKKQIKMSQVLERLRGQYHDLDEKKQSRQTQSIDGLRLEKRRKLTSGGGHWGNTRPKSLLEKARSNTKQITSIYAPKRKPVQQPSARKVPSVSTAFPSSRKPPAGQSHLPTPGSSRSPPPLALPQSSEKVIRPVIKTVTRTTTTKRSSALTSTLPSATSPRALPSGSHSRQNSFSPPPSAASASLPPPSRPISQLPLRSRALPPPPPPPPVPHTVSIDPSSPKPPSFPTQSSHSPPPSLPLAKGAVPSRPPPGPRVPKGLFIPKSTKR